MFKVNNLVGFGGGPVASGATAYRYFRINITDNVDGSGFTHVGELQIMVSTTAYPTSDMTAASSPSPLVAAASTESSGGEAWHGFDGSNTAEWVSDGVVVPQWLRIDLGSGNEIVATSAKITADNANAGRMPKDFTIEGSNDASSWTVLTTVTGETAWGSEETREFTF